ncbi:MAG: 3,4-dihydroxy-2-butanone-4-phosphate synthase [Parvibaculaceae bacterium]
MKLPDWLDKTATSQSALAKAIGVSQGRVSQLIAGASPSLDLALKIATFTNNAVRPEDFSGPAPMDTTPHAATAELDRVEDAIAAIARGEMVVVVDDDDRENEGDLIGAACKITAEQMAFMIRHCCGIVCAPITPEDARRLKLDPMVAHNDAPLGTAFTVSVDYREGLTTGISAKERAATVHALANGNVQAGDFVRPGHVFPLVAKSGGVLMRSGHTEAAVDLVRLAGLHPAGVICELVNDDGTVKRGPQVAAFAREHGLKIISVADLIAYRQARERLVDQQSQLDIDTPVGKARGFAYSTPFDPVEHLAIVFGDIGGGKDIPVRLHREDIMADIFGAPHVLTKVYEVFKREGRGVLVYLREGTAGVPAGQKMGSEKASSAALREQVWRDVGLGAQILRDLNVRSIRLITSSTRHYVGLSGFGIDIVGTIRIEG